VTYLDPARPGPLVATARVTKRGSTLTIVEAEVEQDGKPVAHALATFALLKK
jgi:acyl-coenzyme A thioesterase PaaI-like protein